MNQGIFMRAMAADSTSATIDVIGVIGWEVWYERMREMLRGIPESVKRVEFNIYSPGGDVWEGNGIVSEIGELGKRAETVARVQVAASMATLIALACKTRSIAANGRFLIHNAWTQTTGDAEAHEKAAKTLRDCEIEAANFYAARTGRKPDEMLALMAEERWLLPDETKALGFVQEIDDPFKDEDFADVKQEIVAAGKWPKALVVLPEPESKEDPNVPETDSSSPPVPAVEPEQPDAAADGAGAASDVADALAAADAAGYERGLADGRSAGAAEAIRAHGEQLAALNARLTASEKNAAKLQSERDTARAQIVAEQRAHEQSCRVLREQLDRTAGRLSQYLSGALTFAPEVETWEQALETCGGDYAKAAGKYPQLRDQYNSRMTAKGAGR